MTIGSAGLTLDRENADTWCIATMMGNPSPFPPGRRLIDLWPDKGQRRKVSLLGGRGLLIFSNHRLMRLPEATEEVQVAFLDAVAARTRTYSAELLAKAADHFAKMATQMFQVPNLDRADVGLNDLPVAGTVCEQILEALFPIVFRRRSVWEAMCVLDLSPQQLDELCAEPISGAEVARRFRRWLS